MECGDQIRLVSSDLLFVCFIFGPSGLVGFDCMYNIFTITDK